MCAPVGRSCQKRPFFSNYKTMSELKLNSDGTITKTLCELMPGDVVTFGYNLHAIITKISRRKGKYKFNAVSVTITAPKWGNETRHDKSYNQYRNMTIEGGANDYIKTIPKSI